MTLALILFAFTYCLMLALPRFRPFAALGGAGAFLLLGPLRGAFRLLIVVRQKIHLGIGISNYGT